MRNRLFSHWRLFVAGAIALCAAVLVVVALMIGQQVRGAIAQAQRKHPGGAVSALLAEAGSPSAPLVDRNRAIWALGQLGSPEALSLLKSLTADAACAHESALCQREVAKAVALCEGSFNVGALIWRHGNTFSGS